MGWRAGRLAVALALVALAHAGCAGPPTASLVRTELIFGLASSAGGGARAIAEPDWQRFVDDTIAAEFPDGFTVVDATGQYRMASREIVRERSKILLIVHPAGPAGEAALTRIVDAYKARFAQESVLRITVPLPR